MVPHQSDFFPLPITLQRLSAFRATAPQLAQKKARVDFGNGTCFCSGIVSSFQFEKTETE